MLLLIIVSLILVFVGATPNYSMNYLVDQIPNIPAIDKIPAIEVFEDPQFFVSVHPDAELSALELIKKYGYNGELHKVVTVDGYVLELHRITGRFNSSAVQKPIAFVMHGLLCSSASWVLSGPEKSLGFILSDAGYDVWLGNARGNLYSRKHTTLSTLDKEYWDFSWHEIGTHDLPAKIDHILETTGQEKLFYLGHSQGTTAFFVMATELPEYQNKIQAMFAMAPVAYCRRLESPVIQFIATFSGPINVLMKLIGKHQFEPSGEAMKIFQKIVCAEGAITQPLCSNVLFLIAGFNKDQFNKTLLPIILGHTPAGASTKQIMHYTQLINSGTLFGPGKFRQYDHGLIGNMKKYGRPNPPNYDLSKIQVPVSLHYSTNDWLANIKDVNVLYKELRNPLGKFRVPHEKFNHLDFMWAINVKELLYEKILSLMTHFSQ
ncbi:lipase 3-like [Linepithema humile]|uniref:lipase 3-like n=1 Tax=Linepithema humile TaxID=83485 RepID=UPI00062378AB|nr:PREDICTED: lipase 3-like [Linepithema humile]